MLRSLTLSHHVFLAVVLVTALLAVTPVGWQHPWVGAIGRHTIGIPIRPLSHLGEALRRVLRAPPSATLVETLDPDDILELIREKNEAERQARAHERTILELEQTIKQLQQADFQRPNIPVETYVAQITADHPGGEVVEITTGANFGIRARDTVAFHSGHLVGRVTNVWSVGAEVRALTSPSTELMKAVVLPVGELDFPLAEAPTILLESTGDGIFTAQADREFDIEPGDEVRLHEDGHWPEPAWLAVIGYVESVEPNDEHPLLNDIVVRPRYRLRELGSVVLKVQRAETR